MANETNEFKRMMAMRNILRGNYGHEDVEALCGSESNDEETIELTKDKHYGRYQGIIRKEQRTYVAPSDGIWLRGREVLVEEAYRLIDEDDTTMRVRKVTGQEISDVIEVCKQEIRKMLDKSRKKKNGKTN